MLVYQRLFHSSNWGCIDHGTMQRVENHGTVAPHGKIAPVVGFHMGIE